MNAVRQFVVFVVCLAVVGWYVELSVRAQATAQGNVSSALVGVWTLNKDLSDGPPERAREGRENGEQGRRAGGGGGFRRGGFGGGRGGGGAGRGGDGTGRAARDPEEMARIRDAIRDIMIAAPHLTLVQSENMMIVTTGDGRTTRLSLDGKKIKDGSTKIERKTRWEGEKLISEISGLPNGKIVETYAVDPERKQLHITLQTEGRTAVTTNWVYDRDG